MTEIAIRLDPRALRNPDADLRYEIPEALARACPGAHDDAYDYDVSGRMIVFVGCDGPEVVPRVLDALLRLHLLGNVFDGDGVEVGVADARHEKELSRYRVIHPPGPPRTLADRVSSAPP